MNEALTGGFQAVSMPFSVEAEQSVIGAILLDKDCITSEGVDALRSDHFHLTQHRAIFEVMYNLFVQGRPIDIVTVGEELKNAGQYEAAGGRQYLTQLAQLVPSVANVSSYAAVVLEKYRLRSLILACSEIASDAGDPTNDASNVIDVAEQKIFDIRRGRDSSGLRHINDVLVNDTLTRLTGMCDPETRQQYIGIPTGLADLDRQIAGLNRSDLLIVGARPGMGKTSFILSIARNVAIKQKKTVAVFSLEMSCDQLAQRLLSNEASITSEQLRRGFLQDSDWDKIVSASEKLGHSNIYIDDTAAISVSQIKAKLRRKKVDAVFIDYLQLMQSPKEGKGGSENRVQEIGKISRDLKIMAKELQIPVIVCSQLNRGSVSSTGAKSHRPQMSDLRDSGSIEQDADVILLLYRPDYFSMAGEETEEDCDPQLAECIVAKNRHGSTDTVRLKWVAEYMRYEDAAVDTVHEDPYA
ncbi:MAG: replicative DNA helicase [Clostridia bacterium]|nr:replicative DNA helicase [Clostridia bacterium]